VSRVHGQALVREQQVIAEGLITRTKIREYAQTNEQAIQRYLEAEKRIEHERTELRDAVSVLTVGMLYGMKHLVDNLEERFVYEGDG
jgi:hypothetical protein